MKRTTTTVAFVGNKTHNTNVYAPANPVSTKPFQMSVPSKPALQPQPTWTEIKDLANDMKLLYPVVVKIEREDDHFIVSCPTFRLSSHADTYEDAVDAIKDLLFDDYEAFLEDYPDRLTGDAIAMLRLYCAFLGQDLPNK